MPPVATSSVVRQIGSLFDGGSVAGLTDRELIERFAALRDATGEAAFAALVSRHGPMVLDICQQHSGDLDDAEDAFQAVFLVLARKARSIREPDLLGNWLYGVALRTARKARLRLVRRRENEGAAMMRRPVSSSCVLIEHAVVASALASRSASAGVSPSLCELTAKAASRFASGQTNAEAISSSAFALANAVLRSAFLTKVKLIAVALLILGAVLAGARFVGPAPGRQAGKPDLLQTTKADDAIPQPAPGRMFVVGRVLDPNGKPVRGAAVAVHARIVSPVRPPVTMSNPPQSPLGDTRADKSGRFRIDAPRVSPTSYQSFGAVALAPGYGAGWAALDVDAEQPTAEITLRPESIVHGRVFDLNGRPVPNVTLSVASIRQVLPQEPSQARNRFDGVAYSFVKINETPAWPMPVTTDAEGRYTLRGLGRETSTVLIVNHAQFALQRIQVDTNATSDSKPLISALAPAQILTGGVVYADTGKGAPHAPIGLMASHGRLLTPAEFETDGEGRFHLNPPPSTRSYFLTAYPPAGQPYLVAEKQLEWPKCARRFSILCTRHPATRFETGHRRPGSQNGAPPWRDRDGRGCWAGR